jgi:RNA polymerase sigma-70 factor (ECF subfamily)
MDWIQAAGGREAAFAALFDEHHAPLFRFAWRMTASIANAEDIVQECFLEILRPSCSYDPARTSIRAYLFGAVRNQALKRLRKRELAATPKQPDSPEESVLQSELSDIVARAVRELPETQREVLILAHYEQLPLAEIAQLMELDIGAVKSRLQRARASLKETLAASYPHLERNR